MVCKDLNRRKLLQKKFSKKKESLAKPTSGAIKTCRIQETVTHPQSREGKMPG